jgi:formamidopyrimidine-DNA glycosylase
VDPGAALRVDGDWAGVSFFRTAGVGGMGRAQATTGMKSRRKDRRNLIKASDERYTGMRLGTLPGAARKKRMPELPDVELFRRSSLKPVTGRRIDSVDVRAPRIVRGLSAGEFTRRVAGRRITAVQRHGKYLFFRLDKGCVVLHFGLSGRLKFGAGAPAAEDRVVFHLDRGDVTYANRRMIGGVGVAADADEVIRGKSLGPDAASVSKAVFTRRFLAHGGEAKAAFMDQSVIAGIGNVYADEILFQAGVHPRQPLAPLGAAGIGRLHSVMKRVIATAIRHGGDRSALPASYLTPRRRRNGRCPQCRSELRQMSVHGRTTFFCPIDQPIRRAATSRNSTARAS